MVSKASAMFSRIAPRKARMIADLVRGRDADEAIQLLSFTQKSGAPVLRKIIESAVANAQQAGKDLGDAETLRVSRAVVDNGPTIKRFQPRAQGRAFSIHKRMSHITVAVTPIEVKPKKAPPRATTKTAPPVKADAPAAPKKTERKPRATVPITKKPAKEKK